MFAAFMSIRMLVIWTVAF